MPPLKPRGLLGRLPSKWNPSTIEMEPYPKVKLFSWHPSGGGVNFGDHLSGVIASAVAMERGLTFEDEVSRSHRLLAVGSIMHFAREGDVVWGSGINGKIPRERITTAPLDIRAVRGPLTATALRARGHHVPELFGDPALLVRRYFASRFPVRATRDYVIIPNLNDLAITVGMANVVSPFSGWNHCVENIVSARFVVAGSLHAIIVAEAFGVPVRYLRFSETESQLKYDDYAQGTGRNFLTPAYSIEEAFDLGSHDPASFDEKGLVESFPFDLWQSK